MRGESIDGELMITPGPPWKQALVTTGLGSEMGHSSQPGKSGGADGGIILNPPHEDDGPGRYGHPSYGSPPGRNFPPSFPAR
jgi:hypothetical protein